MGLLNKKKAEKVWSQYWDECEYTDKISRYEQYMWNSHVAVFDKVLHGFKGKRILEVGVGQGKLLSMQAALGANVSGIDISDSAIADAKKTFEDKKLKADLRVDDAFDIGYRDGTFDLVYALGLIEHFEDDAEKKKIISELHRVTKPGGFFILTVPKKNSVYTPKRWFRRLLGKWYFGYEEEFSLDRLNLLCAESGEILKNFPIDIYPPPFNFLPTNRIRDSFDNIFMIPLCNNVEKYFPMFSIKIAHLIGAVLQKR